MATPETEIKEIARKPPEEILVEGNLDLVDEHLADKRFGPPPTNRREQHAIRD